VGIGGGHWESPADFLKICGVLAETDVHPHVFRTLSTQGLRKHIYRMLF